MQEEPRRGVPLSTLLKVMGYGALLALLLMGSLFWWLSSLSDVPPR